MKTVRLEIIKCDCNRILLVVDGDEIEVACGKCKTNGESTKVRIPISRLTGS